MKYKQFLNSGSALYRDEASQQNVINIASTNGVYVDSYIQDSSSKIIDYYFKRQLGTTTLSSPALINSYTLTLNAGHGFTVGDYISILEGAYTTQAKVLNVATNVLTLDSPLDHTYTTGALIRRTSIEMNVDGSVTPIVFNITPAFENHWHINNICIYMLDQTAMDSSTFGGLTALTKGIVIRRVDGIAHNITNIKANGEFDIRGFNVQYDAKAPSGYYGISAKKEFNSQTGNGVTIDLNGATNDELQIIIQDNLTGLDRFRATIQGHYVID